MLSRRKDYYSNGAQDAESGCFSVTSYNILADCNIDDASCEEIYSHCSRDFLLKTKGAQSPRSVLLLQELTDLDSDIYCLQEVEVLYFHSCLRPWFLSRGFDGIFSRKVADKDEGLAIFYRLSMFSLMFSQPYELNELMERRLKPDKQLRRDDPSYTDSVALILMLQHILTSRAVIVGNLHAIWEDWRRPDIQALQIACFAEACHDLRFSRTSAKLKPCLILTGDFNIEPHFPAYQIISRGEISAEEHDKLHRGKYTYPEIKLSSDCNSTSGSFAQGLFSQPLRTLRSAYLEATGNEPEVTSFAPIPQCLDYIWFDPEGLAVTRVLGCLSVEEIKRYGPMLCVEEHFPSDHVSLRAIFRFI